MSGAVESEHDSEVRRFKAYPEYKDSGVEWLGKIPAHWEVKRLKTFASMQLSNVDKKAVEGQEPVRLCNYTDVYYNERITAELDFMPATATPEQVHRFALRAGDVLITKDSESWTDIAVPAVVAEDLPGVLCGYHLAHIRPHPDVDGTFLSRAFAAIGPREQFWISANGITRFGLGGEAIRTGLFALPPLPEQRAIGAFLDRETARIDALVAQHGRLIELLQEKRTVLITRAVTKGLDPNVPTRDSGIEWLGTIPAHWEIVRVRDVALELQTGPFGSQLHADEYVTGGIPVINPVNLYDGALVPNNECTVDDATLQRISHHRVLEGDILFARRGELGRCGLVTQAQQGWVCGTGCLRLRPNSTVVQSRFLIRLLSTEGVADWLGLQSVGATIQNINTSIIGRIPLVVPSLAEQDAIVAFLEQQTTRINCLVDKARAAITCLKELRTTLISAAVTGKIDVRTTFAPATPPNLTPGSSAPPLLAQTQHIV